jgi:hypothetical protein
MTQPSRILSSTGLLALLVVALLTSLSLLSAYGAPGLPQVGSIGLPSPSSAKSWLVLGPETFAGSSGTPTPVIQRFAIQNPKTTYALRISNGGVSGRLQLAKSAGTVTLNGVQVVGIRDWNQAASTIEKAVTLLPSNQLAVTVTSGQGTGMTLGLIGLDSDPPKIAATFNPPPNAAGWNNSDVTVTFTCSDFTSGVAFCPSPITLSTEGVNQVVSGTAFDKAGNAATASVTINLDKTPPIISGSINPPPDAGGWNGGAVTVNFTCADAMSGVASCSSPVAVTSEGTTQVPGTATDVAGNTATANVTVNISTKLFYIRNYAGKCLDYGTAPNGSGATVFLNDCNQAHPIRVEEYNTSSHEVILYAGSLVIGVHKPLANTLGGAPSPGPSPTELPLELLFYDPRLHVSNGNDILFAFDGDSIILASSRPSCIHTVVPSTTDPEGIAASVDGVSRVDGSSCAPPLPAPQPQLVVQIPGSGANFMGLVVGSRNLADSEFWDFNAVDGSGRFPTTGFVPVATNYDLWNAVCSSPAATPVRPPIFPASQALTASQACAKLNTKIGWGSVLVISGGDPNECLYAPTAGQCIDFSLYPPLALPAGVTIRGDRRATNLGPLVIGSYNVQYPSPYQPYPHVFDVQGDYVRVTGLRLQGPTTNTTDNYLAADGIEVADNHFFGTLIDHNDLSAWNNAAVEVYGTSPSSTGVIPTGSGVVCPPPILALNDNVRIERNFIHHNDQGGKYGNGYGSVMSAGGTATISGNTYTKNRHSIAADADIHNQYAAWFNLVLSNVPSYCIPICVVEQTFDMHGANQDNHDDGGIAGNEVDIAWNTFLSNKSDNFDLRGQPCNAVGSTGGALAFLDSFHNNVSMRNHDQAVQVWDYYAGYLGGGQYYSSTYSPLIEIQNNQFADTGYSDPTVSLGPRSLGVGDFDGDGREDVFLATGAAWYYSPAGKAEWRYLNGGKTDRIDSLLLGDFDGDGRTDVVGMNPSGQLVVSWGGVSDWQVLNPNPCPPPIASCNITDMAVGKFLDHPAGDRRDDLFLADGTNWYLSSGGSAPFSFVNTSSFHRKDVLFGDFDGDGKTDVFGVVFDTQHNVNSWSYTSGAVGTWIYLTRALTNTVDSLYVADFLGVGRAAVAKVCDSSTGFPSTSWCIAEGAPANWSPYSLGLSSLSVAGVGYFAGRVDANGHPMLADALLWNGKDFSISAGGLFPATPHSTQEMR